jgi:hypothetical protein
MDQIITEVIKSSAQQHEQGERQRYMKTSHSPPEETKKIQARDSSSPSALLFSVNFLSFSVPPV